MDEGQVRDEVSALFEAYGIAVPDRDDPDPNDPMLAPRDDIREGGIMDVDGDDEVGVIDVIDILRLEKPFEFQKIVLLTTVLVESRLGDTKDHLSLTASLQTCGEMP